MFMCTYDLSHESPSHRICSEQLFGDGDSAQGYSSMQCVLYMNPFRM